ncbi:MAG: TonB family protein [Acidobacteria bacterium]|nr:TonB family protein [Acidobacteriota bacterium]
MRLAAQFSFKNGLEEVTARYPHLLAEVVDTVRAIDASKACPPVVRRGNLSPEISRQEINMNRLLCKLSLATLVVVFGASTFALGQAGAVASPKSREEVNKVRAEFDAGSRQYREGNFAKAEEHFRKALELDPEHKNAPLFLARAIQEQLKPGDAGAENLAKGEEAVEAYRRILAKNPANEDAFDSIISLYRAMRNEEKARETLLERAGDASLPVGKRAGIYSRLTNEDWQCSYNVTEQKDNRETDQQPDKVIVKYKMPADSNEFYKARQCVTRGLEVAEQWLQLTPQNAQAWSYKANLLRESSKLAEMEGDASQKEAAEGQYKDALAEQQRLTGGAGPGGGDAINRSGDGMVGAASPTDPASTDSTPATGKRAPISGGVLNGKAISKPAPVYPSEAREAGAQGTVTVQVLVEEDGSVASATAISGPPLLREAAAAAARQARFSPTLLSGQPVRISGVVTYNFVLQ